VGYSQFRALLNPKKSITDEQREQLQNWLLDPGADLVVADEAHEIKNQSSKITGLLMRIKTGSRIATTGSPLSNNLKEYWAMMNWIHMGFLGTLRAFTASYIEPIKDGLYGDSTSGERRLSQRRLVTLKTLLSNKIHRCDLSVIEEDLPAKTEFVVYVPLTPLQKTLYQGLLANVNFETNGSLFKWINILRLICNHPYALKVARNFPLANVRNISG
jgi:SNF2 family DNA or RNA helicase